MSRNILLLRSFVWRKRAVLEFFLDLDLVIDGPHFFLEFGVTMQPVDQCVLLLPCSDLALRAEATLLVGLESCC